MKKKIVIALLAAMIPMRVNAMSDPSAYYDPEPVHVTAPLSDMVFHGGLDASVEITEPIANTIGEEERDLIAAIIYAEAGNQDLEGKVLVGKVIKNRVADPNFPNTITEVIFQPGQFTTAERLYKISPNVTDECYEAVDLAYADDTYSEVLFFNNGPVYGKFLFRHQDHNFGGLY